MEKLYSFIDSVNALLSKRGLSHFYMIRPLVTRKSGFGSLKVLAVDLYKIDKEKQLISTFERKGNDENILEKKLIVDLLDYFVGVNNI